MTDEEALNVARMLADMELEAVTSKASGRPQ
jgi:hypothetical protein